MCLANVWYDVPHHLFRLKESDYLFRCLNREQAVYVRGAFS